MNLSASYLLVPGGLRHFVLNRPETPKGVKSPISHGAFPERLLLRPAGSGRARHLKGGIKGRQQAARVGLARPGEHERRAMID